MSKKQKLWATGVILSLAAVLIYIAIESEQTAQESKISNGVFNQQIRKLTEAAESNSREIDKLSRHHTKLLTDIEASTTNKFAEQSKYDEKERHRLDEIFREHSAKVTSISSKLEALAKEDKLQIEKQTETVRKLTATLAVISKSNAELVQKIEALDRRTAELEKRLKATETNSVKR